MPLPRYYMRIAFKQGLDDKARGWEFRSFYDTPLMEAFYAWGFSEGEAPEGSVAVEPGEQQTLFEKDDI